MRRMIKRLEPKPAVYVDKESDWETLPHNPLVQQNRVTKFYRTRDLAGLAEIRRKGRS